MTTGSLRGAEVYGLYWVSTAYEPALYAYYLDSDSTITYPSSRSDRWGGFMVWMRFCCFVWPVKPSQRGLLLSAGIMTELSKLR